MDSGVWRRYAVAQIFQLGNLNYPSWKSTLSSLDKFFSNLDNFFSKLESCGRVRRAAYLTRCVTSGVA
jgi:hypothetical protein